jgi:hypothetical protein
VTCLLVRLSLHLLLKMSSCVTFVCICVSFLPLLSYSLYLCLHLSESELLYDWRFTANQFVLESSSLRLTTRIFFSQLNSCNHRPYITAYLTRGWGCSLQLLLALVRAFILGCKSRGTCDHILLSQIRDFPFRRLLRLAGSRWRYSTPPPHGSLSASVLTCSCEIYQ